MSTRKRLLTLIMLVTGVATAFATNGTRMIGFDARTVGRGGTGIGVFDNGALLFTNPAGISFMSNSVLEGDFSLMIPTLRFDNAINSSKGKTNYFPLGNLSYVSPGEGMFSWGAGAFTQGGMGADFMLNHNLFRDQNGGFVQQEYHSKLGVMQGGLTAAFKVMPQLSFGVSAHAVYSMLDFKMPYSLSPMVMRGVINPQNGMTFGDMFAAPPQMGGFGYSEVTAAAVMDKLSGFGFSGKVGLAWNANENVTLGVSYTSPTTVKYKNGKATMDMTYQLNDAFAKAVMGAMQQNPGMTQQQAQAAVMQQFGQLGVDFAKGAVANYDLEAKLKFPQSVGMGGMFRLAENIRFAFDFEWINWKNAFDNMSLTLKNGDNPNINRMMGNDGNFSIDFPMQWEDAFCSRFGVEIDASEYVTARVGAAFGSNPVPDATVFPVFPAIVETHVTAGVTYNFSPAFALNAAYEMALNKEQTAGVSRLAQEYNGSTSQLTEDIFHLSFTWTPR